ncbi:MAG TPA: hypothetical protein VFF33_02140 [Ignavibacteriaceae bacterium]|nr:hypothetical protein [Ignavibacteriaceae bacterium]
MKDKQDYIKDIAEIRSMMERSSKFLSLSGWAGIMAGVYALIGVFVAYKIFHFNPQNIFQPFSDISKIIWLACLILLLALSTAIFLSYRKANNKGDKVWNAASKQLLMNMAVPLISGGILILILIINNLIGLIAPFSLLFYGMALYNAGKFTYQEVKFLGIIEIVLGLICSYFVQFGLLFWALGFGMFHIIYGIYLFFRYER